MKSRICSLDWQMWSLGTINEAEGSWWSIHVLDCLSCKLLTMWVSKLKFCLRNASLVQVWYEDQGLSDHFVLGFKSTSGIKFLRIYFVWQFDWILKDKAHDCLKYTLQHLFMISWNSSYKSKVCIQIIQVEIVTFN